MTRRGDGRPTTDPVDGVYEIEVEDDSPADVLRDAVEATEATDRPEGAGAGGGDEQPPPGDDDLEMMREKYLRALADYDNYRKRVERERSETARAALVEPLRQFLGVADNLDRALRSGGSFEDLRAGVEMIQRQTADLVRRFGVEEVRSVGEPFDPTVHEAVLRVEDPDVEEQTVSEEFQKGYLYQGRLLRPALVKVAVPVERGGPSADEERSGE